MKVIKEVKIKWVTGIRYLSVFDRMDGKRDYRRNQLCEVDGGVTTPRVVQKCRSCDQYSNEIYLEAVKELESLYTDIAVSVEEFFYQAPEEPNNTDKGSGLSEEELRQAASRKARLSAKTQRRKDLILHLAELQQRCRNIDETLSHNLDRAKSALRAHVESYWSGVLQGAVGERLPVSPIMVEESLSGKPVYLEHQMKITELLNGIFDGGEAS